MTIVAHAHPFVIGVDAYARNHAVAVVACPNGEVVDEAHVLTARHELAKAARLGLEVPT